MIDTTHVRPARLAVGVISAGRVGAVLGASLARAGHVVVAASAVSRASLRRAEELLPGVPVLPPDEVAAMADLVLLAVPDDVLPGLVSGLIATGSLRPGQIVAHTSGAHGVAVLAEAARIGALPLALHPVMTFTGRGEDLVRLAACCIGITATGDRDSPADPGWSVGEALVVEIGADPVFVPEAARPLYHAALAHGANHLATLITECVSLLSAAGIAEPERLLGPLCGAALDNALRHGDRALTGPVARGDLSTLRAHLDVLGASAPEVLPSYRVLAARTADRARAAGVLPESAAAEVDDLLDEENR
ncbi:putative short-subunit dehydrogenase-like oxidoreductase (DUF2520 family) [Actinoalloteichus hoggarensis]|uniref:Rossmann-like domain protein n=1 Tax=Actinoalloteichus hoggarensis TaxID=1470176 RepID=A0A221VWR4_9PSEU|nr:DUF2520 domain-containing protein [Actinoalloteichus hoggarensis]ASO17982.1 Rossmann-like domain protein [Actinoalloteichus hoggarensis]MBB5924394.1 putative short-subunit dehydrogenase-like oxidoreductase (DUF2520 family) [Actinoalloteichus hoggarensis]